MELHNQAAPYSTYVAVIVEHILRGERIARAEDSATAKLIQDKGHAHEAAFLRSLQDAAKSVQSIDKDKLSFEESLLETRRALAEGPDYIYQAALASGRWSGYADFLERVARPSRLGAYSYEIIDTKLKRSPDPKHVIQLALYSDLLAKEQGVVRQPTPPRRPLPHHRRDAPRQRAERGRRHREIPNLPPCLTSLRREACYGKSQSV